ncbi:MAG: ribonuclease HI family protein [Patescibacteria group bacterium]|nr:ribonuclease HI family protein [Patescibacteria group bacterium]
MSAQAKSKPFVIYTDGGSRGNPGPSAIGVYVLDRDKRYGEYVGEGTNNEAEYQAIVFALKKAKSLLGSHVAQQTDVEIRSDSQLVVNQLSGLFKLKEAELFQYFISIWNLKQDFKDVSFVHIPREKNSIADRLVNETLDEHQKRTLF